MDAHNQRGLLLIETLVVIGVIGILSSFATVLFTTARRDVRDIRRKTDMVTVGKALRAYHEDAYPKAITITPLDRIPIEGLAQLPRDPDGSSYQYASDGRVFKVYLNLERTDDAWTSLYFSDHPDYNVMYSNDPKSAFIRKGIERTAQYSDWYEEGTTIYANGGWRSVTYTFTVPKAGDWTVSMATRNHDGDMYAYSGYIFNIYVRLDTQWPYDRGRIQTPGTNQGYSVGALPMTNLRAGTHTLTFTWSNDSCPGCGVRDPNDPRFGKDANLQIGSVSLYPTRK